MADLHTALTTATDTLREARIAEVSREAESLFRELRETNRQVREALADLDAKEIGEGLRTSLSRFERSLERADALLGGAGDAVRSNSAQLMTLLVELSESLEALNDVLDDARDDPSLLLLGEPPEPVELPRPE
jgi:ABC-type transporter Mla subunit MlaD